MKRLNRVGQIRAEYLEFSASTGIDWGKVFFFDGTKCVARADRLDPARMIAPAQSPSAPQAANGWP